jgi:hypothetical protein
MNTFQDKVVGYYKGLPIWAKGLTIIGGGVILYVVYKKLLAPVTSKTKKIYTTQQVGDIGTNIPYEPYQAQIDYRQLADAIFTYMDGVGTYENDIVNAIDECRNQNDWLKLQQAYGTRKVSSGYYFNSFTGTLKQCLANELDSYWINKIKNNLADKGISY